MIPLGAIPWRLIGYVGAVLALVWMLLLIKHWREDSVVRLPEALAALKAEVACGEGSQCKAREIALQEAVGRETVRIVTGYEAELAAARSRQPVSIRVCDRGGLPNATDARTDSGSPAAPGVLPGSPAGDRDIGPALSDLAREADEVAARLRALQEWNTALSR